MAVVGVAEERPLSPKGKVTTDEIGSRSYTREFRVLVDSVTDGLSVVTNAPNVPRLYSPYNFGTEQDDYALLRTMDAERYQAASLYWIVRCEYRTLNKSEINLQYENPLLQLPEIEMTNERYQEVVYAALDDFADPAPCANSAGQIFDPPPSRDRSRTTITIVRNESIVTPIQLTAVQYQDTLNQDPFWGFAAGQVKCQGISAKREMKQLANLTRFPYLRVTYKFEARDFWTAKLLDAGTYYLDANLNAPNNKVFFPTADGYPIVGLLRDGEDNTGGVPVFLEFNLYVREPFGKLNLPNSFIFGA